MDSKSPRECEFNRLLLDVIEETMSCLGELPTKTILFYLDKKYNLPMQDVPSHLEEYSCALERMLGVGARILELRMLRQLCSKVQSPTRSFDSSNDSFANFVFAVKSSFLKNDPDSIITIGVEEDFLKTETIIQSRPSRFA
jgi:hypothetical protein